MVENLGTKRETDLVIRNEPSNLAVLEGGSLKDYKYEVGDAPVDFVLFTDVKPIYVELKTVNDFAASIKDKRLWKQSEAMKNEASRGIFVIEGSFYGLDKWHPEFKNSVIGAERALLRNGHELIFTFNKEWTATFIKQELDLLNGIVEKRKYTLRATAGSNLNPSEQAQYVVEGFPGIGGVTSETIRQNTSSLWNLLETINYKPDTIKFLPRKLVERIKNICMTNWKMEKNESKK